jgi:hypothetical protein
MHWASYEFDTNAKKTFLVRYMAFWLMLPDSLVRCRTKFTPVPSGLSFWDNKIFQA